MTKALFAGETGAGMVGGLAVVNDQTEDHRLGPFVPLALTRQYKTVFAGRSLARVKMDPVEEIVIKTVLKLTAREIWNVYELAPSTSAQSRVVRRLISLVPSSGEVS